MFLFPRKECVLAAAFLLCGIESPAQSFTNGGFEMVSGTPIASNTSRILNPGDTWLTDWSAGGPDGTVTVQNGNVGMQQGTVFDGLRPWEGQQWAIFPDDTAGGSLSQTFQTSVGGFCSVSFYTGYVYTADDPFLGVTITAADSTVLSNNLYEVSYRAWTPFQLSFVATTPTTTLTFYDGSAEAEGADIGLDGMTVVTEPSGWPYVITSPQNSTNAAGSHATFTASAGGYPSTVQWYLGSNVVPNATNTTLTIVASITNAGNYTAVFSNAAGTNATLPATLAVLQVTGSPTNQMAAAGAILTLTASVNLSQATNQWYFGPNPIPGATSPTLVITAGSQTAGMYSIQFGFGPALVTSDTAVVTVFNIPFSNGSFESSLLPPNGDQVGNPGDTWLAGWTFGGCANGVFVFNGSFFGLSAADGNQWVVFDSQNSPPGGTVSQTFSTTAGQTYDVTFSAVAIYYDGNSPKSLMATATASDGTFLAATNIAPLPDWSTNQLTFTAATTNTTLTFTDTSAPNIGPSTGLDAVSVVNSSAPPPPPPVTPTLTALSPQPVPGSFVIRLAGPTNQVYVLETSTNLPHWVAVATNVLTVSPVNITNAPIIGAVAQFWAAFPGP